MSKVNELLDNMSKELTALREQIAKSEASPNHRDAIRRALLLKVGDIRKLVNAEGKTIKGAELAGEAAAYIKLYEAYVGLKSEGWGGLTERAPELTQRDRGPNTKYVPHEALNKRIEDALKVLDAGEHTSVYMPVTDDGDSVELRQQIYYVAARWYGTYGCVSIQSRIEADNIVGCTIRRTSKPRANEA